MLRDDQLVAATLQVVRELHAIHEQLATINNNNALLNRLAEAESKIMSAISQFAEKQNAFNARMTESQTTLTAAVEDLTGDIQTLNDKITELQNSPGGVTPEDQAMLDSLSEQGEALSTKAEALSEALKTLAAIVPPKPPVG